ncbi:MAG: DUF4160 domain-containing protein [Egibacteraceae bacterium]
MGKREETCLGGRSWRVTPLWFYYQEEHQLPHVAVRGEHRATIALDTGDVLAGYLPPKLHRTIRRFLAEHRDQAYAAWEATRRAEPPGSICS